MPAEHNSHNTFAYPGFPHPHTHPDRLAAMAILHGLNPAPVEKCRVLEIGCNEGANLIPMAYAIPSSEFVGFDLARLRIEQGQQRILELGLKNARIFEGDLLKLGSELGRFDYIVAHGFYAWVPEPVGERMMALCGELLARGHARSGDAQEISGYLGSGARFAEAIAEFGHKYADQTEKDWAELKRARK